MVPVRKICAYLSVLSLWLFQD